MAIEKAVLALKGVCDAYLGAGGVLVYPEGSPEGYLTVAAAVDISGYGSERVSDAARGSRTLDGEGYVAEGVDGGNAAGPRMSGGGYIADGGNGSSSVQVDEDGYVAEASRPVARSDSEGSSRRSTEERCPLCRARLKWCACEGTTETRL